VYKDVTTTPKRADNIEAYVAELIAKVHGAVDMLHKRTQHEVLFDLDALRGPNRAQHRPAISGNITPRDQKSTNLIHTTTVIAYMSTRADITHDLERQEWMTSERCMSIAAFAVPDGPQAVRKNMPHEDARPSVHALTETTRLDRYQFSEAPRMLTS